MKARSLAGLMCVLAAPTLYGAERAELLQTWRTQARAQTPGFSDFSAQRGRELFTRQPADWSCATCHTKDARNAGRHAVTHKAIKPLSPLENPARFTDQAKVEKWFRRNCRDVFERECTPQEKGDVLTWLLSLNQAGAP